MSSALEAAGAVKEPSEYASLSMDRHVTGLWTQRSPLRDADVPYLYGKFYSASRFDSLIDGVNREITSRLTIARRSGNSIWNSNTFPAINSFYAWKSIVSGSEVVRVIVDAIDGFIYDATANGKLNVSGKSAGAGRARFQSVNTTLYWADGIDNNKYLQPAGWVKQLTLASTTYQVGTTIIDSNGNLQFLTQTLAGNITNVQISGGVVILTFNGTAFNIIPGQQFQTSITTGSVINGTPLIANAVTPSGGNFIVTANFQNGLAANIVLASSATTGTATSFAIGTPATTGNTQPTWNLSVPGTTVDGNSTWNNYGKPVFPWGAPAAPARAPVVIQGGAASMGIWKANSLIPVELAILDNNGNIQTAGGTAAVSGNNYPKFNKPGANTFTTTDGSQTWTWSAWFGSTSSIFLTGPTSWQANFVVLTAQRIGGDVIVDSNGNLQMVTSVTGGGPFKSGGSAPTWNTTLGGTTSDGSLVWTNIGSYLATAFQGIQIGYAYHCVDGSVSTLSPLTPLTFGILGTLPIQILGSPDGQVDSIWIFATADGGSTPLFELQIENNTAGFITVYLFYPQTVLVPQLPGPQASSNNPPPVGMTAPTYHLGRIFAIYQNAVICTGGPNTIVGNGFTSFAPLNTFPIPEQPIRLFSGTTAQGPALFIWGTSKIWAILGAGTPNNPFQQASKYMDDIGINSYDAVHMVGSTAYAFTGKSKCVSLDPGAGYVEVGFPIGDQFKRVTTGQGGKIPNSGAPIGALYTPASTYVTWAELSSGDTAVYVSDGSVGWFRFSPVASPESGFLWSPRAVIVGGTSAVQGVETSSGITQLLIGPKTSGPILFRDASVNTDNGTAFPSYDTKGNIVLCTSGEVAEIAHVALKSAAVGARPVIGLLLGEISATLITPFDWLSVTSSDPPTLPKSTTMYSDRYVALQNGVGPKCDNFQLCIDYGTQAAADETLLFSVYGAKHAERKQQ